MSPGQITMEKTLQKPHSASPEGQLAASKWPPCSSRPPHPTLYQAQRQTHIGDSHHLLGDNVVQDEGEGHLVVVVQEGINRLL